MAVYLKLYGVGVIINQKQTIMWNVITNECNNQQMEVTIYEGLGRYDVIYREIGIHGKYAKKYYFYVICYTNVFVYVV